MLRFLLLVTFIFNGFIVFASPDTVKLRALFHDRIDNEQKLCDKADGKLDGAVKVSGNDEINLQVTDAVFRRVNELEDFIENSGKLNSSNEKIRYLVYLESLVREYRLAWKARTINPVFAPLLVDNFEKVMNAQIDSVSMEPFIEETPFEVGKITTEIFKTNPGYEKCKNLLYVKFCYSHPDKILSTIRPYVNEYFADSLVEEAARYDPVQLYNFASARNSPEGKLIHRNKSPLVKAVADLSKTPNALFYFPFLDNLLKGNQTIDSIKKYVGDGENGYDSVGYYKLLVRTEEEYSLRLISKDTPIAMFGPNGLRDVLQRKAIQHFITPINNLHEESNLNIRMRAIDPLSPEDIYFMMVMGENDIYTSSYKHSFNRMLAKMGASPRTDQLLMNVNMDYFKKFIKMAANFNQLDTFLRLMPKRNSETLMKAFVANLDNTGSLEDAVDVADSYSSIKDKKLLKAILQNVTANLKRSVDNNSNKGKVVYGLLKTIFLSADDPQIDLTSEIGIPSIYTVDNNFLADDSGRVIQQVFFYGDEDGKGIFTGFINSFSPKEWKLTMNKEWVEIKSLKGKKVWIYANRPLNNDKNEDDSAQIHLNSWLDKNELFPTVAVHRGHSYWLPRTIERMPPTAKIVVLGSCGGYKNLNQILEVCPDAHIITTKEIGKGDINKPILNYLNQIFVSGKVLAWKDMWASLTKFFSTDPNREVRESWDDYVPPYKNLGAIFIKAYNKKMEGE